MTLLVNKHSYKLYRDGVMNVIDAAKCSNMSADDCLRAIFDVIKQDIFVVSDDDLAAMTDDPIRAYWDKGKVKYFGKAITA